VAFDGNLTDVFASEAVLRATYTSDFYIYTSQPITQANERSE
jgi:hypothetical protein